MIISIQFLNSYRDVGFQKNYMTKSFNINNQKRISDKLLGSANEDAILQCKKNEKTKLIPHPKAPISLMRDSENLLHNLSALSSVCDQNVQNLRVIQILNRLSRNDLRDAIRQTYGNLSLYKSSDLKGNYTKFFLVGKPQNENEERMIAEENQKHKDIVVANIHEGYYNLTLKVLIGMKFAACFCSHADYFIKVDDDDYLRIKFLDQVIIDEQNALNARVRSQNIKKNSVKRSLPAKLYMGGCGGFRVQRPDPENKIKNPWQLTLQEYSENWYPPYCGGPFYMFSMSVVFDLIRDCPNTCIGLDPRKIEENKEKPCLWKFEDTFIGSCVWYTQRNITTRINISYRSVIFASNNDYKERSDPEVHLTVHGVRRYERMIAAHHFYLNKSLVY